MSALKIVAVARRIIEANGGASNLAERCFEEVARGDAGLVLGDGREVASGVDRGLLLELSGRARGTSGLRQP